MKRALACLLTAAVPSWAQQAPAPAKQPAKPSPAVPAVAKPGSLERPSIPCADCGVVLSVRTIVRELPSTPSSDAHPTGFVYSIPLGGGKAQLGSSSRLGRDVVPTSERWEITVRLDDGRYRLLTTQQEPELRDGDKVRIDQNGRVNLRTD